MSAPKQPSPDESDDHNQGGAPAVSQIQDLVARLTLETRLHSELRKNYDDMIESSEDYIKSLQEEMVSLEQKQWHEREKMQDVINGLTIKCQLLERKRDMCENVEEISLMKIKEVNALEDEIELREEAFYSRQSKAYRNATQKYQESVAETSQSIAQEAVLAYLDSNTHLSTKEAPSGEKGKSFRLNSSQGEVKKLGKSGTADFLDKQLNDLRVSKKDLAREVEILEETNRQQTKIILHLRKRLAMFNEMSPSVRDIDVMQSSNHDAFNLSASSLFGVVPSLSGSLNRHAQHSSDDDLGSSTMLTECRPDSRKKVHPSNHGKSYSASPTIAAKTIRPSTSESIPAIGPFTSKSHHSLRTSSRTPSTNIGVRRGLSGPKESPSNNIAWSQPHPEYEDVIRACQSAKISDTAYAIMQNKHDESGTRLLIRLLSGLHPDPQLCAQ